MDHKPKGILKSEEELNHSINQSAPTGNKKLKWDEESIQLSELDRGTRQKITEPKTPYVRYDEDNDTVQLHKNSSGEWLPPLKLNETALEEALNNVAHHPAVDLEEKISVSSQSAHEGSTNGNGPRIDTTRKSEWDTTSGSDDDLIYIDASSAAELERKKQDFLNKRSRHYEMKNALKLGKTLVDTNEDDDGDQEMEYQSQNEEEFDDGSAGDDESDDYEQIGERQGRSVSVTSASSATSSQPKLYKEQPTKPALRKSVTSDDSTAIQNARLSRDAKTDTGRSRSTSSKREKHVRIVDSRTKAMSDQD